MGKATITRLHSRDNATACRGGQDGLAVVRPISAASPLPCIELNDDDLQIQFAVYEQTASITMPYFPARTDELMECVRCCLHTCREERGYVAYDPQLGRVVTVNDLDQIAQLYRASVVK